MAKEGLSNIEKELRFRKWCSNKKIKRFLLDLDDTISLTGEVFSLKKSQCANYLAEYYSQLNSHQWLVLLNEYNNKYFESCGVNPNIWTGIISEIGKQYSLSRQVCQSAEEIIMGIYYTPLSFTPGAEKCLGFLKRADIQFGIVTHANIPWTDRKYQWLRLDRFIPRDAIYVIDENGHKTPERWREAIRYFNIKLNNCAVVGDSPRSDINPALENGVSHCFLVGDGNGWSIHNHEIKSPVNRISQLDNLIDAFIN